MLYWANQDQVRNIIFRSFLILALEERAEKIDLVVEDATLQAEFRQLAPLGEK